jgi:hypothetical protein
MNETTKRLLPVGLVLVLAVAAVPGGALAQDDGSDSQANLDSLVSIYNANVDEAPSIARNRFAGETLEIRVGEGSTVAAHDSGTAYGFVTNGDGVITAYGSEVEQRPSIRVRTSEQTLDAILSAEDPAAEFNAQYEAGNVEVNGLTLTKSVEVEAAKFAVWLGKTLGFL